LRTRSPDQEPGRLLIHSKTHGDSRSKRGEEQRTKRVVKWDWPGSKVLDKNDFCAQVPFTPDPFPLLVDLIMDLLGHIYSHYEEGFMVAFAVLGWLFLAFVFGSMIYFIVLVASFAKSWT
jgi:hypothetical protein